MKKLLIALMLLAVGVMATEDYLGKYADYRNQIKRRFNVGVTVTTEPWSDTTLNQFVRDAVVHHSRLMRGPIFTDKIVSSADVGTYAMDTALVDILGVWWSKNDSTKSFLRVPREQWYTAKITPLAGKAAFDYRPSYYDWSDSLLWLYPVPDGAGDTIVVQGWRRVPSIAASDNLSVIPQELRPTILDYVVWQIAMATSSPMVQMYMASYQQKLADLGLRREQK